MKETVESLVSKAFAVEAGVDARQLASLRALAAHEAKRRGSRRMAWRVGVSVASYGSRMRLACCARWTALRERTLARFRPKS